MAEIMAQLQSNELNCFVGYLISQCVSQRSKRFYKHICDHLNIFQVTLWYLSDLKEPLSQRPISNEPAGYRNVQCIVCAGILVKKKKPPGK